MLLSHEASSISRPESEGPRQLQPPRLQFRSGASSFSHASQPCTPYDTSLDDPFRTKLHSNRTSGTQAGCSDVFSLALSGPLTRIALDACSDSVSFRSESDQDRNVRSISQRSAYRTAADLTCEISSIPRTVASPRIGPRPCRVFFYPRPTRRRSLRSLRSARQGWLDQTG